MVLNDKIYSVLKTLGTIILPAVAVFYDDLAGIWGLPFADQVPQTIMAVVVLLNSWLGLKSAKYYEEKAKIAESMSTDVDPEEEKVM